MDKRKTGLTVERISNGFIIGFMRESSSLFSRKVELYDTMVAKTEQEVIDIMTDKLKELKPREIPFEVEDE